MGKTECRCSRVALMDIPKCLVQSLCETAREVKRGRTGLCAILSEDDRGLYMVGFLLVALVVGVILRERERERL